MVNDEIMFETEEIDDIQRIGDYEDIYIPRHGSIRF